MNEIEVEEIMESIKADMFTTICGHLNEANLSLIVSNFNEAATLCEGNLNMYIERKRSN